ncbi:MAG TPA: response regulator [Candidatus Paceibacterota bacterium]|nr:response regulator [Candidatus Paceibacterota bacterium]
MDKQSLILLVDEDQNFREIFTKELEASGFRVETAQSGQEGIEKAKQLKPDLVLMDVKMPIMDGIEASMKMKQDPETSGIKVVFLTSLGVSGDESEVELNNKFSRDIGANGYIKKTEDLSEIVSEVKNFF